MENIYVDVVIRNAAGDFLCQHHINREHKPWRFPGGKPKPGELLIVAAAREAKEELGIDVLSLRYIGKKSSVSDGGLTWTGHAFLCDTYLGPPSIIEHDKHDQLQFFSLSELKAMRCEPEYSFAHDAAGGIGD